MRQYFAVAGQSVRSALLVVLLLALAGCAATGTRLKAYSGPELAEQETATLAAPANVKVLTVNGQKMTSFLLDDMALNFSLRPGTNQAVVQYRSIWARHKAREDHESAVNTVESEPVVLRFDAEAGATYQLEIDEVGTRSEAQQLAADVEVRLVDESGQLVASSTPYTGQEQHERTAARGEAAADPSGQAGAASQGDGQLPSGMSTLDALNLLWQRATREEKEAFLQQAFD